VCSHRVNFMGDTTLKTPPTKTTGTNYLVSFFFTIVILYWNMRCMEVSLLYHCTDFYFSKASLHTFVS